jgi:hypothetical protein
LYQSIKSGGILRVVFGTFSMLLLLLLLLSSFLRRRHLAERADVIVTIEGGNIGTKQIVDYALKELKKLEEVWSGTILSQL